MLEAPDGALIQTCYHRKGPKMNHPINDDEDHVVLAAVAALRAFAGDDLDRERAAVLLPHYVAWRALNRPQRAAILQSFPPIADLGWISGAMR